MLELATVTDRAARYFPWLAYDPESKVFLLDDGYVGFGFTSEPLSGWESSVEQRFRTLLTYEFPVGSFLQFNLCVFDDIGDHLERIAQTRNMTRDPLIRQSTVNTMDFLERGARGKSRLDIPIRNSRSIITVKIPIDETTPSEDELLAARRAAREIGEILHTIGFADLTPLNESELIHQLSVILNRGEGASWRQGRRMPSDSRFIRDDVLDYDGRISITDKHVEIGDTVVTSLSVKKLPAHAFFGLARSFSVDPRSGARGIPCAHMITGSVCVQDINEIRAKMENKRKRTAHFALGPYANLMPEYGRRYQDLNKITQSISDGEFVHRISLNILLFSPDADAAERNTTKTRTYLAELGLTVLQDTCVVFPLLRANLPFGPTKTDVRDLARFHTLNTNALATLLPAFYEWRGTPSPLITLVGRGGQVMGFSPWDTDTNYNLTISASSGSGKSFFANELITALLGAGGKVWVIDVGLSYQKLCESLGGQFLRFGPHSDICLNPFSSVRTQEEFDEVADILKHLIATMAAPKEGLNDFQNSQLVDVLREGFQRHGSDLTIDLIAEALFDRAKEQIDGGLSEKRISDVAHGLSPFRSGGTYGKFFNGPANIDFDASFVCLELEELKSQRHLQTIVLLLLIYQIQQGMYLGDRSQKKMLLIDEAWDLLSDDQIAGFIEAGYRRFRKYNGSAAIITQSLLDLTTSKTGQAITSNSAATIMLKQSEAAINKLSSGDEAQFDKGLAEALKTVHTVPGSYSEVFVRTAAGQGIGRFVVDPFTQLLYSTHPRDKSEVDAFIAQGLSTKDAIDAVLRARAERKGDDANG
ncbi:MAG: type IV secretion system protein TraC [Rhodovulum sulfidophilum]|uniref:Type IV secretion system protein TraC n=1 Tax=Rhodovulum sulfidophilum TaxID=35806 RepID=A0A2W5N5V1_RHOSU|nr:MAG: type IV secretion system protein TraC [Rhodovulum sulfidophilum]